MDGGWMYLIFFFNSQLQSFKQTNNSMTRRSSRRHVQELSIRRIVLSYRCFVLEFSEAATWSWCRLEFLLLQNVSFYNSGTLFNQTRSLHYLLDTKEKVYTMNELIVFLRLVLEIALIEIYLQCQLFKAFLHILSGFSTAFKKIGSKLLC